MPSGLLPLPVVIAALRCVQDRDLSIEDEDCLFDEWGGFGRDQLLPPMCRTLLGNDYVTVHFKDRDRALSAVLADMLREHHRRRQERAAA